MLLQIIKKIKQIIIASGIMFILINIFSSQLFAAKPVTGIAGVTPGSLRVASIAGALESQIINVVNGTGIFSIINPNLLKDQLTRYKCTEEDCILAFAGAADVNLIIRADVEDKGNSIIFNIYSYSINAPYFGKIVYKYRAEIPVKGLSLSAQVYNYIAEEHAVNFTVGLLRRYRSQIFIKVNNNEPAIDQDYGPSGVYDLYRYENNPSSKDNIRIIKKIGRISLKKDKIDIISPGGFYLQDNDFIFAAYDKKADYMENFFYAGKREMVFGKKPMTDTSMLFFLTVPMSALMPVIAPLGYYRTGDFTGLSLWAVNSLPYLYIEYRGLNSRFGFSRKREFYKDDSPDHSRNATIRYRFGLYMLFCGGMPLVIDALTGNLLYLASGFQGVQPYIGNTPSAVYLSLISGGGGHFYKGHRLEGYMYFHAHNILLYMSLKEFASGSGASRNGHKKKAYAYLGGLGLLKAIEIAHVLFVKDNIRNGKLLEETGGFEPAVYGSDTGPSFGGQYVYRY